MTKKAIIVGASSGIGRALAITLARHGYEVGLMARRLQLLQDLQKEIPTKTHASFLDIAQPEEAVQVLVKMIDTMQGVDLIVINSGTGFANDNLVWSKEKETLDVNVYGFTAMAGFAFNYFAEQGAGHIVGISSIAGIRGNDLAPAYGASKAYMSNYLQGLRKKAFKVGKEITVTDIKPGYVDTDLVKSARLFWAATPNEAAEQIYEAIKAKRKLAYITKRWRLIAWLFKIVPDYIFFRF